MSKQTEKKRSKETKKVIIIIVVAALILILLPSPYSMTDGGSMGIVSLWNRDCYDIRYCHALCGGNKFIDGVEYIYFPFPVKYRVGLEVYIMGKKVIDATRIKPEGEEPLEHEDEIRELVSYYRSHKLNDAELITVSATNGHTDNYITLVFSEVTEIEESDEIVKVVKGYLSEHPESFLNDNFKLTIYIGYNGDSSPGSIRTHEASYIIYLPDTTVTELEITSSMIPDDVPSYRSFEDVEKIKLKNGSTLTDKQVEILRSIYPNAEIAN